VYVLEAPIEDALDGWLAELFDPEHLDDTCHRLAAASEADATDVAAGDAARRTLSACDERLQRYRLALEEGADPAVVATWIAEVQGERLAAERTLADRHPQMTPDDVRELMEALTNVASVLSTADPSLKARAYGDLGLRMVYRPADATVLVSAAPHGPQRVSEGGLPPQVHAPCSGES
jgi:hypothetical protein